MKNFLLVFAFAIISSIALSQDCARDVTTAFVTTGNKTKLQITGDADGQKRILYTIYNDGNVIMEGCLNVHVTNNHYFTVSTPALPIVNGVYTYSFIFAMGTCGSNGARCPAVYTNVEASSLPVQLGLFSAERKISSVNLKWNTEQEINVSAFEIEKSIGGTYQKIGEVKAYGNSTIQRNYAFSDNSKATSGVSFYRIKMIDKDGTYEYSPVKSIKGNSAAPGFIVFPNPSTGNAKISITDLIEPSQVNIVDNAGRTVKFVTLNNSNSVDLYSLQKGGYIITVTGKESGTITSIRLTVMK